MAEKVENIPISRLNWLDKVTERRKMPTDHFLEPTKRLFPVKNVNGTYNCYLIRAALVRAAALHRNEVEAKARKLYYSLCAKKQEHSERYLFSDIPQFDSNEMWVNVLPFGEFVDPDYGLVSFDKDKVQQIVNNFKKGIPTYEPPLIDKEHITDGKFGEVKDLKIGDDGLYALIKFTDEAFNDIKNNKFKYMSPVIQENYLDKNTGEEAGAILKGVALTNMPRIPGMLPLSVFADIKSKSFSEKMKALFGGGEPDDILSDEESKLIKLNESCDCGGEKEVDAKEFNEKLKTLQEENEGLKKEIAELKKEKFSEAIESWGKEWTNKGVAPAVVEQAVNELKNEPMKFSDDNSLKTTFEKIFATMAKIDTNQYSEGNIAPNLDDETIAKKDAKIFNGGEK